MGEARVISQFSSLCFIPLPFIAARTAFAYHLISK
jgi:hypothetical protein